MSHICTLNIPLSYELCYLFSKRFQKKSFAQILVFQQLIQKVMSLRSCTETCF